MDSLLGVVYFMSGNDQHTSWALGYTSPVNETPNPQHNPN